MSSRSERTRLSCLGLFDSRRRLIPNSWYWRLLIWRFQLVTRLLCPLGLHAPWPRDMYHADQCAYCGAVRKGAR